MLVDIPMKFQHGIFNGFQDTERTRLKCLFGYFQFQRAITRKLCNPELRSLCSAHRFVLINFMKITVFNLQSGHG